MEGTLRYDMSRYDITKQALGYITTSFETKQTRNLFEEKSLNKNSKMKKLTAIISTLFFLITSFFSMQKSNRFL